MFLEQVKDLGGVCTSFGLTKEKDNHSVPLKILRENNVSLSK